MNVNQLLKSHRLETICDEIGNLKNLEVLALSENLLTELPETIGYMTNLKVLTLQANDLISIPLSLGNLLNLDEIDCTNNPRLEMIPEIWRGVLFIYFLNDFFQFETVFV